MLENNDDDDGYDNDAENEIGSSCRRSTTADPAEQASRCDLSTISSKENGKSTEYIESGSTSSSIVDPAVKYANLFVFSGGNKAGMQAMDKAKQAQVIYELSKNTPYFKRAMKLDEEAMLKAKKLQKSFSEVKGSLEIRLQTAIEQRYCELEKRRSLASHICCVLDMDMFFAAVEIRDQPHLASLPVAVGGIGMISTSNYVARQYGVRAAMPGFIAKKLCPHLVFVKSNFEKYQIVSNQIKEIISEYDPKYSSWSLDEVYFDLIHAARKKYVEEHSLASSSSSSCSSFAPSASRSSSEELIDDEEEEDGENPIVFHSKLHQQQQKQNSVVSSVSSVEPSIFELRKIAVNLLQEIRQRIKTVTNGLTCSAGMANNFFLAKIGADINKPDGQYELPPTRDAILSFLTPLPTRKIGGIGKVTEKTLSELGIHTIGDVRENATKILHAFTPISTSFLLRVSLGIASEEGEDNNLTEEEIKAKQIESRRKSIGCERTFSAKGIFNREDLYQKLKEISQNVSNDIKDHSSSFLGGKCITIKVKDINFNLFTKAHTSSSSVILCEANDIFQIAKDLLDSYLPMKVRLLGVSMSKLVFREDNTTVTGNKKSVLDYFSSKTRQNTTTTDVDENHLEDPGESRDGFDSFSIDNSRSHPRSSSNCYEVVDLLEQEDEIHTDLTANSHDSYSSCRNEVQHDESVSLSEMHEDDVEELEQQQKEEEQLTLSQHDYDCPICGNSILQTTLISFNQHIDECLTKNCLREVLSDEEQENSKDHHETALLNKRSVITSSTKDVTSHKKQRRNKVSSNIDISLFFSGK
jgi:DNA polymerase kappa